MDVRSFLRRQAQLALAQRSAAVAFWLVIAAVPAGLVTVNVLGLFIDQREIADRLGQLAIYLPGSLGDAVAEQLLIVAQRTPGSGGWDVLLVVLALWTMSTAVVTLIRAIRVAYGRRRTNPVILRVFAFILGFAGVAVVGSVAFVAALVRTFGAAVVVVEGVVGVFVVAALIATFYWLTGGFGMGWRKSWPGALAASVALLLIAVGLSIYADHAPTAKLVYGTATGLVVSLLATWLSVYAVLLGALFNASQEGQQDAQGSDRR